MLLLLRKHSLTISYKVSFISIGILSTQALTILVLCGLVRLLVAGYKKAVHLRYTKISECHFKPTVERFIVKNPLCLLL